MTKPTGHSVSYYVCNVDKPNQGVLPYTVECGDVIEALGMTFSEGCAFKGIWRSAAARTLGKRKTDEQDPLYDAQKVEFYGRRMQSELGSHPVVTMKEWQTKVHHWGIACFGEQQSAKPDRRNRFLEESLELVQSLDGTAEEAHQLVNYVFGRPKGEPNMELGGVLLTVGMLANANDLSMNLSASAELVRVWGKIPQIRAKDAAKPANSPLPGPTDYLSLTGKGLSLFPESDPTGDIYKPILPQKKKSDVPMTHGIHLQFSSEATMREGFHLIEKALKGHFQTEGPYTKSVREIFDILIPDLARPTDYSLNSRKSVAVSTKVTWRPIDEFTPRGVKMQLISKASGVATYGSITSSEEHWTHWAPVPAWDKEFETGQVL